MPIFLKDNLEKVIWSDNPLILITHDEYIFSTYDESQSFWIPNGE